MKTVHGKSLDSWCKEVPVLLDILSYREAFWVNPDFHNAESALLGTGLLTTRIKEASERLKRFQPFIAQVFPETTAAQGVIESPLLPIPTMQQALAARYDVKLPGTLLLKCDHSLPISGSVKARGGIYEVLHHAEKLAISNGMLTINDNYTMLAQERLKKFFSSYSIAVGSTGNLGLSIGIMGAKFGFQVTVHMSSDARQWKKTC